jgi:hypothetical protein
LGTTIKSTAHGRYGPQEAKTARKWFTSGRKRETGGKTAHVGLEMGNIRQKQQVRAKTVAKTAKVVRCTYMSGIQNLLDRVM